VRLNDACAVDAGLALQADRTRLKQVLLNLLSNAVKYNRLDGHVTVECERHDDHVCLRVSDTGPGLDEQQQQRLFVPFERLAADTTQVEGTGIGLALARRLVELMHGRIGVVSQVGVGSTFWVCLPVARVGPPLPGPADLHRALARPDTPQPRTGAVTVLSIDDDAANQRLIASVLASRPEIGLLHANRPGDGIKLARQHRPAVILLDILMPEMDGYEVLRILRADAATQASAVLAISANAMPDDVARGRQAGFDDYLTKPIDVQVLLDAIDAVLAR
jgi:CheY-like chemotaxis protein/anti-sigma regulatory factor (Ser/Thr protein kinase)